MKPDGISPDPVEEGLAMLHELLETRSPSGEESRASALLVAWLGAHGFDAECDGAGNAVGVLEPLDDETSDTTPGREIILLGHIDTVPGFPPVILREGKLYGRGAVDAKGPLAAFATAAATVGRRRGWRIIVVGAVEEESASSKGARYLLSRHRPDLVVIGEPTGWQRVALGYKGRLLAEVRAQRVLAHTAGPATSAPEMTVNFWNKLEGVLSGLNSNRDRAWDQIQATIRGFSSSTDGLTEVAKMSLGFRLPMDTGPDELKQLLISADGNVSLSFRGEEHAYRADKNTPLVHAFLASVRVQGGQPSFVFKTGTSDMNVVGPAWRCPIVAYGPGDGSLDHTPGEHVEVDEWRRGVAVLTNTLLRLTS